MQWHWLSCFFFATAKYLSHSFEIVKKTISTSTNVIGKNKELPSPAPAWPLPPLSSTVVACSGSTKQKAKAESFALRSPLSAVSKLSHAAIYRLNMTLVYALVSRQKTVLAEYTATSGEIALL